MASPRSLYERHLLPHLVHVVCGSTRAAEQRRLVVPRATGEVLEIGFGSGHNLAFYRPEAVTRLIGLEPSEAMWDLAQPAIARAAVTVETVVASAEEIPLADASVDSVVSTYTLCTVPEASRALAEVRRVLRPEGRLLFCEHGEAPDATVRRWQQRLDPLWTRAAGGCHLGRPIAALVEAAGFVLDELETAYLSALRPAAFNYRGVARPGEGTKPPVSAARASRRSRR